MPVIRGHSKRSALTDELRKTLLEKLEAELSGNPAKLGAAIFVVPLVYEIPLERLDANRRLDTNRKDVIVVWDEFRDLRSEERSALILDAYKDQAASIELPLGVTLDEAIEQNLLPYDVKPISRSPEREKNEADIRQAMLDEGGFPLGDKKIVLRFPTWAMAEEASLRLMERVPQVHWYIEQVNT